MSLSRVIDHVKAQNWTAVFLDFFIVVAGILIAFQITDWSERRAERARATGYLERLDEDIASDIDKYTRRALEFCASVANYGDTALNYADNAYRGDKSYWQLLVAFFQASQLDNFDLTHPTFDEMTSAGDIGLIRDVALRKSLSRYYGNSFFNALSESPDYRRHVRGEIPIDIQTYIWSACFKSDPYSGQTMIECDAPVSEERAKEIVDALAGDPALMSDLRYWISNLRVVVIISTDRIREAQDLRNAIRAALDLTARSGNRDR